MKTIQLTHNGEKLDLSTTEAIALHGALSRAMKRAGIDPDSYSTVESPAGVHNFSSDEKRTLTDC